jgi:hypothetical protein
MNTLNNENLIYVPNTLDGENIVSSHLEENSLLIDGTNQMLANLNAGNHRVTHVSNAISANDAVNKGQLDLKADTTYLDGNFFNKTTATTQIVNSNLDMNTKRIYNLSNPTTQTDAVNLSYLSTNYLNKTTTFNQTIANKVIFTNQTTDLVSNPVIHLINAVAGSSNGNFIRINKSVVETPNTQIGGLSACDKNIGNTIIRVADLIFSRGSNGEARMDLEVINGNRNPLTITDGEFISRNNNQTFLKQDLTNLLNYTTASDKWTMYKELDMNTTNKIINLAEPTDAGDAVNKQFLDTNFLNKVTNTTQTVASRLTFDNTTSGSSHPIINLQNAITGSNKGMYLQFFKDFVRVPDTEIGSIVFADKEAITLATNRAVELTASIDDNSNPLLNIKFDSGLFNPLTISNTQTILRTDAFYIKNKTTLENVFTYLNSTDKFTMSKPLDMNTNDITNVNSITADGNINTNANMSCVDFNSSGNQILGTNSSSSLIVKSSSSFEADVLIESDKHLAFYNSDLTAESGVKMYFDRSAGSLGRFYIDMRGSEIQFRTDSGSAPTSERVKINNNETQINNNLKCNGSVTLGNNINNDTTTFNSVATFNADVLVDSNKHLMLGGNPASTQGMRLVYDAGFQANGTAYIDSRATSLIFRLNATTEPLSTRVVIGNNQTLINSGFAVNGNTIIGNDATSDTCLFNCQATFPDDSKLTFVAGSNLEFNLLSFATFNTGSGLNINSSAINLNEGAVVNGSRINLRSVSAGTYTMSNSNTEGGILCVGSAVITIKMPPRNAYWNNRSFYIKGNQSGCKIENNNTEIDDSNNTITITTSYPYRLLAFDDDYENNGKIWIIGR